MGKINTDIYSCATYDLMRAGDDEILAHIVECYCRSHNHIPSTEEIESWSVIQQWLYGVCYFSDLGSSNDYNVSFFLDATVPFLLFTDNNNKDYIVQLFTKNYRFTPDTIRNFIDSQPDELSNVIYWENVDVVGEKILNYFNNTDTDNAQAYCVALLDNNFYDWGLKGYYPGMYGDDYDEKTMRNTDNATFKNVLIEFINKSGMTDPEVYKKAQLSRAVFNSVINTNAVHKKTTIFSLAIALHLNVDDTVLLLEADGQAFKPSSQFDSIIKEQIEKGNYDLFKINEILADNGLPLLGSQIRNVK